MRSGTPSLSHEVAAILKSIINKQKFGFRDRRPRHSRRRAGELPRAAISVQGPVSRMSEERVEKILDVLRSATELIAQLPILDRLPET